MKLVKTASGKNKIKMSRAEWTNLGKKAGWISKKAQSAYDRWLDRDDDDDCPDCPDCPDCDGPMDFDDPSWRCSNDECDGFIDNSRTPDGPDDEGGDFGRWGPE